MMLKQLSPLRLIALYVAVSLAMLSVARLGFLTWQWDRVSAVSGGYFILLQGLRFDLVLVAMLALVPALLLPIFALGSASWRVAQSILVIYLTTAFGLTLFMELATPSFIDQFDLRPNIIFVEYLKYPTEVFSMLWVGYKAPLLIASIVLPLACYCFFRIARRQLSTQLIGISAAAALVILVAIVGTLTIRSTLDHRPVNPSTVAFSTDLMVNDLALNSSYTVLYAIYESRRDEKGKVTYGTMPEDRIISLVRQASLLPEADFDNEEIPTLHRQRSLNDPEKRPNLVIVLEESLGAEFVGSLGGLPLTPELDQLAEQGIWFERLYATGTRSVRGIEALITGFLPTPARSVVKLNRTQHNFFTIARLLKAQGYTTSFIYGGEAHFDNMRRFFMANGFETIIDQKNYPSPGFVGSWGVSDEDLFDMAHSVFSEQQDQPFFSLVFTSSNHSPFEYPEHTIELYDQEPATENNAVKYADYALGRFIERARSSSYWDNTLFLIVADHNSRVRGASLVPVERFHIPGLILGAHVKPQRFTRVASQIDLPVTMLSLMGISSSHPAIGHDLLSPNLENFAGRAIMQYNATQAYLEGDRLVIFERGKPPALYDYIGGSIQPANLPDPELMDRALAHALWGPMTYSRDQYRLP